MLTEAVTRLVFQLAIILLAARLGGELCERYLKQSPVLGELAAGMVIGPYVLGGISFPGVGPLFPLTSSAASAMAVSPELYVLSQIGAIILLFFVGLETDLHQFLKYVPRAGPVALGGVLLPFVLGAMAVVFFGVAPGFLSPEALFMGAAMTATSVGITARVLMDIGELHTPEAVTILAAAVIDDVLGILVLTVVVGIAATGIVSLGGVALVVGKALGVWLVLTGAGILLSRHIARFISSFRVAGAGVALSLAVAFLGAGLAQSFGLAMIIGAYSMGLALSKSEITKTVHHSLSAVYGFLVPVFFVVMGMQVDFMAMKGLFLLGAVVVFLAILSKVIGCGLPAWGLGFKRGQALRIGVGMMPRGEVGLIVAGMGLTYGVIQRDLFGVTVMMVVATTLLAPVLMVPLFRRRITKDYPKITSP